MSDLINVQFFFLFILKYIVFRIVRTSVWISHEFILQLGNRENVFAEVSNWNPAKNMQSDNNPLSF